MWFTSHSRLSVQVPDSLNLAAAGSYRGGLRLFAETADATISCAEALSSGGSLRSRNRENEVCNLVLARPYEQNAEHLAGQINPTADETFMDVANEEPVVLRWRSLAEGIPNVRVDGISHHAVIVIQIGKDDHSNQKSVHGKKIASSLRLGNGEEPS